MKLYTARMITCDVQYTAVEEGQGSTSRSKQREEQRESNILFYNP